MKVHEVLGLGLHVVGTHHHPWQTKDLQETSPFSYYIATLDILKCRLSHSPNLLHFVHPPSHS